MKKITFMMLGFALVNSASNAMLALAGPSDVTPALPASGNAPLAFTGPSSATPAAIGIMPAKGDLPIYRPAPLPAAPAHDAKPYVDPYAGIRYETREFKYNRLFKGSVLADLFGRWKQENPESWAIRQKHQPLSCEGISIGWINLQPETVRALTDPDCIKAPFMTQLVFKSGYDNGSGNVTYEVQLIVSKSDAVVAFGAGTAATVEHKETQGYDPKIHNVYVMDQQTIENIKDGLDLDFMLALENSSPYPAPHRLRILENK